MKHLSNTWQKIKVNLFEYYIITLIIIGLPLIALVYVDMRASISVFIIVNILLGVLAQRGKE